MRASRAIGPIRKASAFEMVTARQMLDQCQAVMQDGLCSSERDLDPLVDNPVRERTEF